GPVGDWVLRAGKPAPAAVGRRGAGRGAAGLVTARILSWPEGWNSRDCWVIAIPPMASGPPMRSAITNVAPRYGTCVSSGNPAFILNISPVNWLSEPGPLWPYDSLPAFALA